MLRTPSSASKVAPCTCSPTFRPCPGLVNRERDAARRRATPRRTAPRAPRGPVYQAPWEFSGPLSPSAVPFHVRPEVVSDVRACRACGARAVAGLPVPAPRGVLAERGADPRLYRREHPRRRRPGGRPLVGRNRYRSSGPPRTRTAYSTGPLRGASAVPLAPVPTPAPPGWRLPHPLDGPGTVAPRCGTNAAGPLMALPRGTRRPVRPCPLRCGRFEGCPRALRGVAKEVIRLLASRNMATLVDMPP